MKRWAEYVQKRFMITPQVKVLECRDETGPEILKFEVVYAIKQTQDCKARGPNEIPVELLKLLTTTQ